MIETSRLPTGLRSVVLSEKIDFALEAGRAQPFKKSFTIIIFGIVWTLFTSIFVIAFLGPLFPGKEVYFESNGVPAAASPDDIVPILLPALIIGLFVLVGLGFLSWGIFLVYQKGGYFVATPTRLVNYRKGTIRSIDWEQFSGDIELSGNDKKGSISLQLRTGKLVSRNNSADRYVPDVIYISEIPNAFYIEEICRKRIKENDPTPSITDEKLDK